MASKQGDMWSEWFNVDNPHFGANNGDFETLNKIQRTHRICAKGFNIVAAQCRIDDDPNTVFDKDTSVISHQDHFKLYCTTEGLICRNEDQMLTGICKNYNIRFRCHYTGDNENNDNGVPQFDVRIYIILAVVPILIFLIRILWAYVFRRRRQRRRNERRARRRLNASNGEDYDDDSSSTMSGVTNPPPSYQDLFGKTVHVGGRSTIFAISRDNIPICSKCERETCSVASIIMKTTSLEQTQEAEEATAPPEDPPVSEEPELQPETEAANENNAGSVDGDEVSASTPVTLVQEEATVSIITEEANNSSNDSSEQDAATSTDHATNDLPTEDNNAGQSSDGINASDTSQTLEPTSSNMEQSDISLSLNPALLNSINISQPCPCPCHRTIPSKHQGATGFDNQGYAIEGEDVEANRHPSLPGMHIPVFGIHRVWSNLSESPSVAPTELPSYDLAVELMKKKKEKEADVK